MAVGEVSYDNGSGYGRGEGDGFGTSRGAGSVDQTFSIIGQHVSDYYSYDRITGVYEHANGSISYNRDLYDDGSFTTYGTLRSP